MDDDNFSGLDLSAAKEYIFAYSVDAKRLEKSIAAVRVELERWKNRVGLAEGKLAAGAASPSDATSLSALVQAARAKVEEEGARIDALEAERAHMRAKIEEMRVRLPMIKARERSVDPDRLLAELQLMTGELLGDEQGGGSAAAPEAAFAGLEAAAKADRDLEALKRRAEKGDKS